MNAKAERLHNSRFMRACRGEKTDCTPVWLMRQAGRYMKEYREVRARCTFLELCKSPELCCEVTVTAQKRLGVDAAILFADLLPILEPMGIELDYLEGEGPKIFNPVREAADLKRFVETDPRVTMRFVGESVRKIRHELAGDIPLIGFSGAPFTLAAYAIEGGGSRNFEHAKAFMYRDAGAWNEMLARIVRTAVLYLNMQIDAGAQAVQVFDSWVGCLSPADYREYVLPHTKALIAGVKGRVPVIHFGVGTATLLSAMHEAGADVLGVDWHTPLREAWDATGARAVQGNLDPVCLMADTATVEKQAAAVIAAASARAGHIFNLGHGILQHTPVENVIRLVEYVHEKTAGTAGQSA
jgi:uroporphyrinogen decarboxylase